MISGYYTFQRSAGDVSILADDRVDAKVLYEEMCEVCETEHESWARIVAEGWRQNSC